MRETVPLALTLGNEKARSELLITPILLEVRRSSDHRISLFMGIELDVDAAEGLNGVCDWLLIPKSALLVRESLRVDLTPHFRAPPLHQWRGGFVG